MTQELDTDFNWQIKTVQEKRVSAEAQMEVGMIWFKYLANSLFFYGLSEFVENEDVWFDSIFSKPPVDNSTSFVHGTLFYNAIQVLLKSFTKNVPANQYDIRSRIHFNKDGSGESLNSIVNVLILAYRGFHVTKYMLKNSLSLTDFYADFLFCMAGILENNFTKNPAEDLDLVMNCEFFIRLVTIFQDKLS